MQIPGCYDFKAAAVGEGKVSGGSRVIVVFFCLKSGYRF